MDDQFKTEIPRINGLATAFPSIHSGQVWEHMICDENDLRRHIDYLHFNPVKHGLVKRVKDWPYSTFHRFVKIGFYLPDWGGDEIGEITDTDFGE